MQAVTMRTLAVATVLWMGIQASPSFAQHLEKTWIFFNDKLSAAGKTTQVEPGYVSALALERRLRRGSRHVPEHDAPISPLYLNALAAEGIEPVNHSRWLNAVTAYLSAEQRETVGQWPFVRKLQRVAGLGVHRTEPLPVSPVVARQQSRRLDCGDSCPQLQLVNAIVPLDNGINGQGVIVGFVDTRFDYDNKELGHPATVHLANANRVKYRNFIADDPGVPDRGENFHGVMTTSVALSNATGVLIGPCHGADTVYVAHTEWVPLERNIEEDNFVAAVEWMESSGVDVINSSLGYTTFDTGEQSYTTADMDGDTGVTTIAFDLAAEKGVIPVASAGNYGQDPWRIISTPADGDSVIAAGGVDRNGAWWNHSSTGPTADGRTKPDVAAMAYEVMAAIVAPTLQFSPLDGTSFAAPMVTGIVCQLLQVNPDLNPKEVWEVLTNTASQAASADSLLGWGIVNAQLAIDSARARINPPSSAGGSLLPTSLTVHAPYPNPFVNESHLEIELFTHAAQVRIDVYNVLGRHVLTPFLGALGTGSHTITIDGHSLPPGLYTYVVLAGTEYRTGVMMHLR